VFAAGHFGPGEYGKLSALVAAEQVYTAQFDNAATPEQRALLERTVTGVEVDDAKAMVKAALDGENTPKLEPQAPIWFADTTVKQDRLRAVEERLSADVIASSAAVRQAADRRALLSSLLLAGTLVLALALALVTARSLIRPLGRLEAAPPSGCPGSSSGSRTASRSTSPPRRPRRSRSAPGTRSAGWRRRSTPCTAWPCRRPAARRRCAAASARCSSTSPGAARA
jgi:hypothetical protein